MAPLDLSPNELEPYWVPFTANRAFKKRPRLFAGARACTTSSRTAPR